MEEIIISTYKKIVSIIWGNIVLFVTLAIGFYYSVSPVDYEPSIVFLDVGQGDAILIIDSSGEKFLIDGGDGDYVIYAMAKYIHPKDRVIDNIILTHPHQDHLSGLIDVMERYEVKNIFYYPVCYNSRLYDHFLGFEEKITIISKDYEYIGDAFSLELLYPFEDVDFCVEYGNINNASIVFRLVSDKGSVLLMGDAEHEQEDVLMERYRKRYLKADILKAGHHCSRTASSEEFLKIVEPNYAVCSLGEDNKFGHPHIEVIENFQNFDVEYDLTSEEGHISISL